MKAITRTRYGSAEVLEVKEIPEPLPNDNELLVRVHATTVNRTDCGILTGKPYLIRGVTGLFKPSSLVPGTDFAGEVSAVGEKVSAFKTGDHVWGVFTDGIASQAQYMVVREDGPVAMIPEGIGFAEAAASGEAAHYAVSCIGYLKQKSGLDVLVNGGTGGIGSAAIQLMKHYGSRVDAVCAGANFERVKALGADELIDFEKEDFTLRNKKYDFVLDAVGKSNFGKCKKVMKEGAVYMSSELGPGAENLYLPFITKFFGKYRHVFPVPFNCKRTVNFMTGLLQKGAFKPLIDRYYPMENISEAYRYVASGEKIGNIIISYEG